MTRDASEKYMPPPPLGAKYKITTYMYNPCTKFGIDQEKGSKDIERTTQWAEKSGLTLTFEHVT